jgi:hydrogenase-4 component B
MTTATLLIVAVAVLLMGALVSLGLARNRIVSGIVGLGFVAGSAVFMWWAAVRGFAGGPVPEFTLLTLPMEGAGLVVRVDALSAVFLAITGTIAPLVALFSIRYMERYDRDTAAKYYPLLLVLFAAILGVVVTVDLLFFLVFWELMTLTSFFLVAFEREKPEAQRAAFKYFVVNQAGALAMLAGILVLYQRAGSFHFDAVREALGVMLAAEPVLAHLVLLLFFLGFATKAGVLPMGSWLTTAYPAAPSGATAAFGGTMTKLGIYGLLRVFLHLLPLSAATVWWGVVIAMAGVGSLFVGTLTALKQDDAKRLMSFHVIGQVGYMLLGIGMGLALLQSAPLLGALGLLGGVFHMVNHAMYKSCLFLGAGALEYRTGTLSLAAIGGGLGRVMAVTAGCALIASLAIAGVPPLNGFASKWLLYSTGILGSGEAALLPVAALIAMFISLATLASFLKYLGGAFLGAPAAARADVREVPISMLAPQVVLAAICLLFGLFPLLPLRYVYLATAGLPSAAVPPLATLLPGDGGLGVVHGGVLLAAWHPLPVALILVVVGAVAYGIQRAGGAPIRDVEVWTCGEEVAAEAVRYPPGSFYRPFKEAFGGLYPTTTRVWAPRFPASLRKAFDPDGWLYFPLARGTDRAARAVSRTHGGLLQLYLVWVVLGALAVLALVLFIAGGSQ